MFYFIILNLNCGSWLNLSIKTTNEIKMCILYVGLYNYIKIAEKNLIIHNIYLEQTILFF